MNQEHEQGFLLELPTLRLELPFSPILLNKLFLQTADGSMAPLEDIAETIARDQGLTAKVLTLANSAFYGLQSEVRTVQRAVTVLGLNEVRTLVLALGVRHIASTGTLPKAFDVGRYFEHQFAVGLAARALAPSLGAPDPDNLFTAGVLHDLGKLITAQHRPSDWQQIETLAQDATIPFHQAEDRHWGLDHALIGAMILRSWNLPLELTEPVNWHHAPTHAPSHKREALTLCTADAIIHHLATPELPPTAPWQKILLKFNLDVDATLQTIQATLDARPPNLFAAAA